MMLSFFRTVVWFLYFFGALVALIPSARRVQRLGREGRAAEADALRNQSVSRWAKTLLKLAGVRVTVQGLEHIPADRAVVFTPNHQSNYDIPILLTCLDAPHGFVAKVETDRIPLVRTWMRLLHCVFLDRSNARQSLGVLREAGAVLRAGNSMIVFPEGTRSKGGPMGTFKAGAFKMAFDAEAPVVPVVIDGSFRAMEANHNLMGPAQVTVTVLPAVETSGMDRARRKALPEEIAASIAQRLPAAQSLAEKEV